MIEIERISENVWVAGLQFELASVQMPLAIDI